MISCSFSAATGHYTQVAWASTTKIGCGLVTYKSGRWFNNYIVCNYGPGIFVLFSALGLLDERDSEIVFSSHT